MFSNLNLVATRETGIDTLENVRDGNHVVWDGSGWTKGIIETRKPVAGVAVRTSSNMVVFVSKDFKWVNGNKTGHLKFRKTSMSLVDPVEVVEPYIHYPEDVSVEFLDRYDLGVLARLVEGGKKFENSVMLQLRDNEHTRIRELRHILRNYEYDTVFDPTVGEKGRCFFVHEPSLINLNKYPPDWMFVSPEASRGYIRCLFDEAELYRGSIRVRHRSKDYIQRLMFFLGVKSRFDKQYLYLDREVLSNFFDNIGTLSDFMITQYCNVWDGTWKSASGGTDHVVGHVVHRRVNRHIRTESGLIGVNGIIGVADGTGVN